MDDPNDPRSNLAVAKAAVAGLPDDIKDQIGDISESSGKAVQQELQLYRSSLPDKQHSSSPDQSTRVDRVLLPLMRFERSVLGPIDADKEEEAAAPENFDIMLLDMDPQDLSTR